MYIHHTLMNYFLWNVAFHSQLYTGDCYIVLKTEWNENSELDWTIHYWIGSESSVSYLTWYIV